MEKKNKKIYIIIFSLAIILIGGYFAISKYGIFLKNGKVAYTKENIQNEVNIEAPSSEDEQKSETENIQADKEENLTKGDIIKNETITPLPDPKTDQNSKEPTDGDKKSNSSNVGKIVDKLMSSGFEKSSGRKIDTIIIHTSYNAIGADPYDVDDIIKQYKQYEVSAHYLIGRDGIIYRLVKENDIAWHAGVSKMPDGRTNINDFSIGVEVINTKDGKFSDAEYKALNKLIADIKSRYDIKYILGHDDIAPGRKTDPWGIEWDLVNR